MHSQHPPNLYLDVVVQIKLLDTCFEDGLFKDNMKQLNDQSPPNIA